MKKIKTEILLIECPKCKCICREKQKECPNCGMSLFKAEYINLDEHPELAKMAIGDEIYPSSFEVIFKWVCFAFAFICFVISVCFDRLQSSVFITVFLFLISGFVAGYPNILWKINKWNFIFYTDDDVTPGSIWLFLRVVQYFLLAILAIITFVLGLKYNF